MRLREVLEQEEAARLAAWGARASDSAGRVHAEAPHPYRTAFQRDRDRVIHSTAFRRLQYKTQVFVHHEGDHFRNRLTHTLEVAQIARTIARALGANEDLCEAIVLAHDLGHTPFGHSGQTALHALMRDYGGFEHNRQSLRIVDFLELRHPKYAGLNLTHETRAGILKHGDEFPRYSHPVPLPVLGMSPGLEAQIADMADSIAYHNHDIDDGLRSGLLDWEDLGQIELWDRACKQAREDGADQKRVLRARAIVLLIDRLATDLIEATGERLRQFGARSADEVCEAPKLCVAFSDEIAVQVRELASFLRRELYHHHLVVRMGAKAGRILRDLWEAYREQPEQLPPSVPVARSGVPEPRAIADYLAGMTDRFAMDEHSKLFDPHTRV